MSGADLAGRGHVGRRGHIITCIMQKPATNRRHSACRCSRWRSSRAGAAVGRGAVAGRFDRRDEPRHPGVARVPVDLGVRAGGSHAHGEHAGYLVHGALDDAGAGGAVQPAELELRQRTPGTVGRARPAREVARAGRGRRVHWPALVVRPHEVTRGCPKFPHPPRGAEPAHEGPEGALRLAKATGLARPVADDVCRRPGGARKPQAQAPCRPGQAPQPGARHRQHADS